MYLLSAIEANRSLRSLWRATTRITSADRDDLKLGNCTSLKLPPMTFQQMTFLINRNKIILTAMNWLFNDIVIYQQRSKLVVVCNRMRYAVACILCTALLVFMASKGTFANSSSLLVVGKRRRRFHFIDETFDPKNRVLVPSSTFVCMRLYLKWSDGGVVESWSLPVSPSVAFVPIPPWFHHLHCPPSTSNGRHQPSAKLLYPLPAKAACDEIKRVP